MTLRPYPPAQSPRPVDPDEATYHIAQYLAAEHVVELVEGQAPEGRLPPVYLDDIPDAPDTAVCLIGPMLSSPDSVTNPEVRFLVMHRSPYRAGLSALCGDVYHALERDHGFRLTAEVEVMYCERDVIDAPVTDHNGRWIRVDTYRARLRPPTTIYTTL